MGHTSQQGQARTESSPSIVPLHKHLTTCATGCPEPRTRHRNKCKTRSNEKRTYSHSNTPSYHNSFNDLQASFVVSRSASSIQYCKQCVVFYHLFLSLCKFTTTDRPGSTRSTHRLLAVVFLNPLFLPSPDTPNPIPPRLFPRTQSSAGLLTKKLSTATEPSYFLSC